MEDCKSMNMFFSGKCRREFGNSILVCCCSPDLEASRDRWKVSLAGTLIAVALENHAVPLGSWRRSGPALRVETGRDRSVHFSKTHRGVSETLCRILHCLRSNFRFYKVFRTLLGEFSRNDRPVSTCLDPGASRSIAQQAPQRGIRGKQPGPVRPVQAESTQEAREACVNSFWFAHELLMIRL